MEPATSTKQLKFLIFLAFVIMGVMCAITLIDITIKTAVLEESNSLKRYMDEWTGGSRGREDTTTNNGIAYYDGNRGLVRMDIHPRMEKRAVPKTSESMVEETPWQPTIRNPIGKPKPKRAADTGRFQKRSE